MTIRAYPSRTSKRTSGPMNAGPSNVRPGVVATARAIRR